MGVPVANGGDDGQANAFILQAAARGGAANASTAALGGVLGDRASFLRRASREKVEDSQGQRGSNLFIVVNAQDRGPRARANFTTTALSLLNLRARRVSVASPRGR
jgi:hypothetical protein